MNSDRLPTIIYVAKLKNLFWNNNSDLYPTSAPDIQLYTIIPNTQPTFFTKYTGQCVLQGEYNHAIYGGKYYHLKVVSILDLTNNTYEYQLEYDIMMNVLTNGANIKGTLVRTNIPELLEDSLQQTEPILNNPSKLVVCNFTKDVENWKDKCKLKPLKDSEVIEFLKGNVITQNEWRRFKQHINRNLMVQAMYEKDWYGGKHDPELYATRHYHYQTQHMNPLIILDILDVTKEDGGWKHQILDEISKQFSTFKDKQISFASRLTYNTTDPDKPDLKKHLAITSSRESIGEAVESDYECLEVDLSGLKEIIPIDQTTGDILLPDQEPNKTDLSHKQWEADLNPRFMLSLDRQTYLPFKPKDGDLPYEASFRTYYDGRLLNQRDDTNYVGKAPQKITFKENITERKTGYLWWLNQTDFALARGITPDHKPLDVYKHLWEGLSKRAFVSTFQYYGYDYFFNKVSRRNLPSVGFLLWQHVKKRHSFDEYEYIGSEPVSRILVRVGLNKKLLEEGSIEGKWYEDWSETLKRLNWTKELSAFTLKTDHLLWLLFAPCENYPYNFIYRTGGLDPYKLEKYLSNNYKDYAQYATTTDIVRGGKIVFKNPFNEDKLPAWNAEKESLLDKISIYEELELNIPKEEQVKYKYKNQPKREIKQGDIFCDDLEYKWRLYTSPEIYSPIRKSTNVLKKWVNWQEEYSYTPHARVGGHVFIGGLPVVNYAQYWTLGGRFHEGTYMIFDKMMVSPSQVFTRADRFGRKIIVGGKTIYNKIIHGGKWGYTWKVAHKAAKASSIKSIADAKALQLIRLGKWTSAVTNIVGFIALQIALDQYFRFMETEAGQDFFIAISQKWAEGVPHALRGEWKNIRFYNSQTTLRPLFIDEQEIPEITLEFMNNKLVCFIHKGAIKFGIFRTSTLDLDLANVEEQIVEKVDNDDTKKIRYFHIKTINEATISNDVMKKTSSRQLPLTTIQEELLIKKAISHTNIWENDKVYRFDLTKGEHLFDLYGTNWYAVFRNGVCSLIEKEKGESIKKYKPKQRNIIFPQNENLSIYKKMNQKATLMFFGKEMPLNTKFDFITPKFEIEYSTITTKIADPVNHYYHVKVDSKHDFINTWLTVEKEQSAKPVAEINPYDLQTLRLNAQDLEMKYSQSKYLNEMIMRRQTRALERAGEDLDWQLEERLLNIPSSIVTGAAIGGIKGGATAGLVGGAVGAIRELPTSLRYLKRYNTLKDRLDEDKLTLFRDNANEMYFRKQNYEMDYQRNLIQLNKISNSYTKPSTTNTEVQKEFNVLNEQTDINVQILIPSDDQEKKIIEITEKFGCECLIEDHTLQIKNGMNAGLYKYFKLEGDELIVENEKDLYIRDVLRELFEVGTKFIDFVHEPIQEEVLDVIVPKDVKLEFDTTKIPSWSKEVWNEYVLSTSKEEILKALKKFDRFGLKEEEYQENKERMDAANTDDLLFEAVNDVISQRDTGIKVVYIPTKTADEERDKLLEELRDCKLELKNKEDDHKENVDKVLKDKEYVEKINKNLVDEIAKVKRAKEALDEDLKNLQQTKDNLDEELRQCNINLKNVQQAKETCDRINAAEQKKLKAEIGTLKQQIAEKTREKEALNNLKQDLERQIKECVDREKALKTQLDNEKQDFERQLKEREDKEKTLQTQLDDEKRKSADCIGKITNLTNRLKAAQEEAKKVKPAIPNECELLQTMIVVPYEVDIKLSSTGSKAEELCEYLAHQMNEIDNNELVRHLSKYPLVNKVMELIQELDNVPAIDSFRDAMNMPGWSKYKEFLKKGGNTNGEVDEVVTAVNEVKDHLSSVHMHGLKAILDEIAYRVYKAKQQHSVKNKKDPDNQHKDVSDIDLDEDLQFIFGSFMDGWTPLYKQLFGDDINIAIKRKLFGEVQCGTGDVSVIHHLDQLHKETSYSSSGIPKWKAPPEAHFLYGYEMTNCKNSVVEPFYTNTPNITQESLADNWYDHSAGNMPVIYVIPQVAKNYSRYWSRRQGTHTKYFSWFNATGFNLSHQNPGMRAVKGAKHTIQDGIYLHWAGQLTPDDFFKRRIENWKTNVNKFNRALSHEDLRDQIKRERKLEVDVRWFKLNSPKPKGMRWDPIVVSTKIDLVSNFGVKDAYKALWIMTVLSYNGLYMNKVWQGDDGWKYKIQPHSHPFHIIEQQEIIDDMTKIANKTKKINCFMDFVSPGVFIAVVSCLIKNDFSVIELPETLNILNKLDNVGFYEWSEANDADPNDWFVRSLS